MTALHEKRIANDLISPSYVVVGEGAALGTLLGAIAGGAKGAVVGAVAGAAAGAGAQVLTRGKQLRIPAESVLTFRTDRTLYLRR